METFKSQRRMKNGVVLSAIIALLRLMDFVRKFNRVRL